ncbi:MAG: hypothetical protein O7A63_04265 [Acidobacteria bacterium]|nr:hypothetical protein [Acidobacteriota bacterium]
MSHEKTGARRRLQHRLACVATLLLLVVGFLHLASPHPQSHCKGCQTLDSPLLSHSSSGLDCPARAWSRLVPAAPDAPLTAGARCLSPPRAPPAIVNA